VTEVARRSFAVAMEIVGSWLSGVGGSDSEAEVLVEDLWAVLHGMALLHLDRGAAFDGGRARGCVAKILRGMELESRPTHGLPQG